MPSCRLRRKTAAVIVMLSLFLLSGGSAWSADAIRMDNDKLYEETRKAASDRDVLERVFKSVYQYDRLIGDAVESNYDIEPVKIIPWRTGNDSAISIVRIKATRAAKETWYTRKLPRQVDNSKVEFLV